MAKTNAGKKFVRVGGYKTSNGKQVGGHIRSTPSKCNKGNKAK